MTRARHPESIALDGWGLPVALALVAILIGLADDTGREWLRYDRGEIARGELWRLVSGHVAHFGLVHLALNLVGLGLVWHLVGPQLTGRRWLFVVAATVVCIDLALWIDQPEINWYVGLSGVLHGMLAAGLVAGVIAGSRESACLGMALAIKLLHEHWMGPMPGSQLALGAPVLVAAHVYGAIGGGAAAAAISLLSPEPVRSCQTASPAASAT